MPEPNTSEPRLKLAHTLYSDACSAIDEAPGLALLLDITIASIEFERVFHEDFSARTRFLDAVDLMRSFRGVEPWLYGGAAHVGWTAFQLSRASGSPVRGLESLDDVITDWLTNFPVDCAVDLPSGLLGLGVYGLAHPDPPTRERMTGAVLDGLEARLEWDDGAFIRIAATEGRRRMRPQTIGQRDLGVAHGSAGVVAYLASVVHSGLHEDRATRLLGKVLQWLLRQRSQTPGSVFPHSVESRYQPSRSAWCYGDPGIAMALALAARATDSGRVAAAARETAEAAVSLPPAQSRVEDACLCHGAAGLCWFGRKARDEWQLPGATSLVTHWADDIAAQRANGPLYYVAVGEVRRNPSFLEGDLGVALGLLYAATGIRPYWEERMLTSFVTVPQPA